MLQASCGYGVFRVVFSFFNLLFLVFAGFLFLFSGSTLT